jgi:hypothetical protein
MTPQDFLESVTEDHPRRNFKKNKIESFSENRYSQTLELNAYLEFDSLR